MELWRISDVPCDVAAKQTVICRSKDRGMQVTDIRHEKYAQTQIGLGRTRRKVGSTWVMLAAFSAWTCSPDIVTKRAAPCGLASELPWPQLP